jgi:hypothetical protein
VQPVSRVVLVACTLFLRLPVAAGGDSAVVSISVPAAQRLVGATVHVLRGGETQPARLEIFSNVPWLLWASVDGGVVRWREAGAQRWRDLDPGSPLRQGGSGRATVEYLLRATHPATVRFSLGPAR